MSMGPAREGCGLCGADGCGEGGYDCHHHHHDDDGFFFSPSARRSVAPVQEFQFFGNDSVDDDDNESAAWLFDDCPPQPQEHRSSSPDAAQHQQQRPFESPYDVVAPSLFWRNNGGGLTCEVSLGQPAVDVDAGLDLGGGGRHAEVAASATIMSYCGSTFTDAASSTAKEVAIADDGESLNPNIVVGTIVEREAKVMRYKEKEKRKKRCYDKQTQKSLCRDKAPSERTLRQSTKSCPTAINATAIHL